MSHQQIKDLLDPILENLISDISSTQTILNEEVEAIKTNSPNQLEQNDFRPGSISRLISTTVASRFAAIKIKEYINDDKWYEDYRENHMPNPWKEIDYFGHFREVALLLRFHLIHSIYSQIETTNRIIIRQKGLRTNGKPASIVNELTNTYDDDFIKFVDFIRNTIHNNGHHLPTNANNNSWQYEFNGKNFNFQVGTPIDLQFGDMVAIMNELIDCNLKTLKHEEIVNMPITKDLA